jgi:hypothetical protein
LRNGSGTYNLYVPGNPVITGTTISSTWANNTLNDIATALTNSIAKDGQTTPTANLPMGTFKLTGLGVGSAATDSVNMSQLQSGVAIYLTAVAGVDTITASATPAITAYAAGNRFTFVAAGANTGAVTLNINGLGAKAVTKGGTTPLITGDILSGAALEVIYDGTQFQLIGVSASAPFIDSTAIIKGSADATKLWRVEVDGFTAATTRVATPPDKDITLAGLVDIRSYIAGLTMSTAGASATMSIAAGSCNDSTNAFNMQLSAIAKTTSAWAVGTAQGGLDTGAIANSTWYHFYAIRRPDTGVVDVTFSTNASLPTLPANYTLYRYIGSGLTNGSAQWTRFFQDGDEFSWDVATLDVNVTTPGTAAVSRTLNTPLGQRVKALINAQLTTNANTIGNSLYLSDLTITDTAPSLTAAPLGSLAFNSGAAVVSNTVGAQVAIWTNTSSQIRSRVTTSDANTVVRIATTGYINPRGKNL